MLCIGNAGEGAKGLYYACRVYIISHSTLDTIVVIHTTRQGKARAKALYLACNSSSSINHHGLTCPTILSHRKEEMKSTCGTYYTATSKKKMKRASLCSVYYVARTFTIDITVQCVLYEIHAHTQETSIIPP